MTKNELIKIAEELNAVCSLDPKITWVNVNKKDLLDQIKQGALWMYDTDPISEDVLELMRQIYWTNEDMENLEDPEDQNPRKVFAKFGIPIGSPDEEEPEPEPEPEPEEEPEEPEEYEEDPQKVEARKKKTPVASAYGMVLALMGPDPEIPIQNLYTMMEARGYDMKIHQGSIKTARSIFRRVYGELEKNGFITKKS